MVQEVGRLANGITIETTPPPPAVPPPPILNGEVTVRGIFYPLDQAAALGLVAMLDDPGRAPEAWRILGFQPARRLGSAQFGVPAMLSLRCALVNIEDLADTAPVRGAESLQCLIGDTVITRGSTVALSLMDTEVSFSIDEVLPHETAPIEIVLRTVIRPEVAAAMRRDSDDSEASPAPAEHEASLLSFEIVEEFAGQSTLADRQTGVLNLALVQLRVPATEGSAGWSHLGQPLKVGADYTFETTAYVLRGQIVDMRVLSRPSPGPSERR